MTPRRIAVVGVGRLGAVTAVGLAHLGHQVAGIDTAADRVADLQAGRLAEAEPGLRTALTEALRSRDLTFTGAGRQGSFELAFLCVDTPPLPTGEPDLRQVFAAARSAAGLLQPGGVLVTRSTIPVGTGERIESILGRAGRGDIAVVHVPEFLREGHAWEDFISPDRIVIGASAESDAGETVGDVFVPLETRKVFTTRRTAEFAKYAANAFLATTISFANEISDLGEAAGIDMAATTEVLRADRRIGEQAYLVPGLGFGGHCLPKDTAALEHLGSLHGLGLPHLRATRAVNAGRAGRVAGWLRRELGGLDGRRVALAGLAFKPGTDDLRESPSVTLARTLSLEGAEVSGWDPHVRVDLAHVSVAGSLAAAVTDADALVVAHAWAGWRELSPGHLANLMRTPLVFDAPGSLDPGRWVAAGFRINRPGVAS